MTTAAVAIYAALVATAGFGWQIYTWRRTHSTALNLKVSYAFIGYDVQEVVMIAAINKSNHPVRVTSAGLVLQDGSKRDLVIFHPPPGASIPGAITPRDSGNTWLAIDDARRGGLDLYEPLVAWVNTAEDKRFTSKPTTLMRRSSPRRFKFV